MLVAFLTGFLIVRRWSGPPEMITFGCWSN